MYFPHPLALNHPLSPPQTSCALFITSIFPGLKLCRWNFGYSIYYLLSYRAGYPVGFVAPAGYAKRALEEHSRAA